MQEDRDFTSHSSQLLVHYGPIWDERLEAANEAGVGPVAVLVCHGMGQQVRYQTISSVATALLHEARQQQATVSPVEVRLVQANDDILARAEIKWEKDGLVNEAHIYEAYWAPLTEGRVGYWDTIKFLFRAGWTGLTNSRPFLRSSFNRWMFGGPKSMGIGSATWIGLAAVLIVLVAQVGLIAAVSLTLAAQSKVALASFPIPKDGLLESVWQYVRWLVLFLPGAIPGQAFSWVLAGKVAVRVAVWLALASEVLLARYFLIEYVGDVAAYISPYKDSKFDEIRHSIRNVGINVGRVIFGIGLKQATVPNYSQVVIVGHSLGSVLAYDTLNSLINEDQVCAANNRRDVVGRTRQLITFGSPLDKTAFMFRLQVGSEEQWVREQLAASIQPLIVNERYRTKIKWINLWSPMDIISGSLDYYDDPDWPARAQERVQNVIDRGARVPLYAHIQYWGSDLFRRVLFEALSR